MDSIQAQRLPILGKTLPEAEQYVSQYNLIIRVVEKDKQPLMVLADYKDNRINVAINSDLNIVTQNLGIY